MLEDDSGRIQLVGNALRRVIDTLPEENMDDNRLPWADMLVTGIIMAALGFETPSGEFEVKDVCFAGMAPMMYKSFKSDTDAMDVDGKPFSTLILFIHGRVDSNHQDEWIAVVSGLQFGENPDFRIQMLLDYLTGEGGGPQEQHVSSQISRLIIAGNSLAPVAINIEKQPSITEFGPKSVSYFNVF